MMGNGSSGPLPLATCWQPVAAPHRVLIKDRSNPLAGSRTGVLLGHGMLGGQILKSLIRYSVNEHAYVTPDMVSDLPEELSDNVIAFPIGGRGFGAAEPSGIR